MYNRLPEDEPSGLKHVENVKLNKFKTLIWKACILLVYVV